MVSNLPSRYSSAALETRISEGISRAVGPEVPVAPVGSPLHAGTAGTAGIPVVPVGSPLPAGTAGTAGNAGTAGTAGNGGAASTGGIALGACKIVDIIAHVECKHQRML